MSDPVVGRASPFKARSPFRGIRAPFRGIGVWGRYPARTNSIRNNTMVGAVAGTPGTLPTNWTTYTAVGGLTRTVVGTGIDDGFTYLDLQVSGTAAAGGTYLIYFEPSNVTAASIGQTWTGSMYLRLSDGSLTNVSVTRIYFEEKNAANGYVTEQNITVNAPTTGALAAQRRTASRTLTGATTAGLAFGVNFVIAAAGAVNLTLRIAAPQLERGTSASSPILTSGAAVSRVADTLVGA